MSWSDIPYLSPYLISLAITISVGIYAWRRRDVVGASSYAVYALAEASMTLGYVFELVSTSLEAKLFWDDIQWVGTFLAPLALLSFALRCTERRLPSPKRFWGLLVALASVALLLIFTDDWHGLIRPSAWLVPGQPFAALEYDFSTTLWVVFVYIYGLVFAALFMLFEEAVRPQHLYRAQAAALLTGTLVPVGGTILTVMGVTFTFHRDMTPVTFAIGNLVVAWGLFRSRLFDIVPVARDTVIESMSDAVVVLDTHGRVIHLNPVAQAAAGRPVSEIIGRPVEQVFSRWHDSLSRRFQGVEEARTEVAIPEEGGVRHFDFRLSPLRDQRSHLVGRLVVVRDITDRVEAQEALRESEAEYRRLVESTVDWVWSTDAKGRHTFSNEAIKQLLGYDVSEIVGIPAFQLMHPDDRERIQEMVDRAIEHKTGWTGVAIRWLHKDGSVCFFESTAQPILDVEGHLLGFAGIDRDITERVRVEEELRKHRDHLEELVKEHTARLRILREVDQAILAAESPQAIAQAALSRIQHLVPCQRATVLAFDVQNDLATPLAVLTGGQMQSPTASAGMTRVSAFVPELQQGKVHVVEDILSLVQVSSADRFLREQGIRAYISVPLLFQGELIGSFNLGRDAPGPFSQEHLDIIREVAAQLAVALQQARLHEQVKRHADELERRVAERTAELAAANEHLRALSRVKDEFVSNVSHELRTPISNVKLYLHLLGHRPEKHKAYMATLGREVERLEDLIEGLLTLSRLDQDRVAFSLAPVDLNISAKEYVADRGALAESRGLTLTLKAEPILPTVDADRNLIGQVLSILLTNALNYTPAGGQVIVSTQKRQIEGRTWAGFSVSDTGPGIPLEEQDQLFTRFYRGEVGRKSGVSGTGLGLAIAHEIIGRHGGWVEVESEGVADKGATFSVWLPVGDESHNA